MINSRIAQLFAAIIFVFCFADAVSSQTNQEPSISGHVFYKDGSPVAGAEVEWHSFNAVEGILPSPAHTDEKGSYRIDKPMIGSGMLSASKVSEGFPNAALRIYGKFGETGYSSLKELTIKPNLVLQDQDLRFGTPDAILTLRIIDEKSSKPITAQVAIELPDDPNPMITETILEGTAFQFVIPKHAITVRVSAPDFTDWSRDNLSAPPGTRVDLVAALRHK